MPYLQLILAVGSADPSAFEDALFAAGALSVTLEDAADNPVLEPAPGTTPLWPSVRIKALFDSATAPAALETALRARLTEPVPALNFSEVADRVWEREWLKDFRPMRFGHRLWVCPDGQRPSSSDLEPQASGQMPSSLTLSPQVIPPLPPSRQRGERESAETVSEGPCFIDLDPGLAFGTGTHPTTALCLAWLESASLHGKTIIDYGCGSGILAIAALKLGAASALAVDIDSQAITATLENATRNGVADRLTVATVAALQARPADILVANILAEPLITLAASLSALVRPSGHIVLSGVLSQQAPQVAMEYAPWFDIQPICVRDEWACIEGVRKVDVC
jgi:ribosomal protein L11 methyltransferase